VLGVFGFVVQSFTVFHVEYKKLLAVVLIGVLEGITGKFSVVGFLLFLSL